MRAFEKRFLELNRRDFWIVLRVDTDGSQKPVFQDLSPYAAEDIAEELRKAETVAGVDYYKISGVEYYI